VRRTGVRFPSLPALELAVDLRGSYAPKLPAPCELVFRCWLPHTIFLPVRCRPLQQIFLCIRSQLLLELLAWPAGSSRQGSRPVFSLSLDRFCLPSGSLPLDSWPACRFRPRLYALLLLPVFWSWCEGQDLVCVVCRLLR
jgi:hypothetical protein